MAFIEAKDYGFEYDGAGKKSLILDELEIDEGELVLVFGRSGCGKTTLMRRLAGQDMFRGTETGKLTVKANSHGYVWQDTASQIVCDRVESELVFGMENMGYSKELMERRLAELVMFFGLDGLLH